uniref:Uncharacterized protein n=1 Tax=Nothobranchius kadleci TaxID=1051664 RepID=A0A1A8E9J1_NOTKA
MLAAACGLPEQQQTHVDHVHIIINKTTLQAEENCPVTTNYPVYLLQMAALIIFYMICSVKVGIFGSLQFFYVSLNYNFRGNSKILWIMIKIYWRSTPTFGLLCQSLWLKLRGAFQNLIKSYLRSTMFQGRLTNLALISINHSVGEQISHDDIIDDVASRLGFNFSFFFCSRCNAVVIIFSLLCVKYFCYLEYLLYIMFIYS